MTTTTTENETKSLNVNIHNRNILIVEDDHDVASLAQYIIQKCAHTDCDIVNDSYEAIEALCEKGYDYLVIDQNLPGLKGVEFLKALDRYLDQDPVLSEQERFLHKIPAVIMSSSKVTIPKHLKLKHFQITEAIDKEHLNTHLERLFGTPEYATDAIKTELEPTH